METYSLLRTLADSWGALAMLAIFLGICFWAFRPGSRAVHDEAANSIFRNERAPAEAPPPAPNRPHSTRKEA
jgi:cytochrome c oxidase cbb3-type subunit 4